jgi:hypothetical protein
MCQSTRTHGIRIKVIYIRSWWRAALSRFLPIGPDKAVEINAPFVFSKLEPHKGIACLGDYGHVHIDVSSQGVAALLGHASRVAGYTVEFDAAPPAGARVAKPIPPKPIVVNGFGFETGESARAREAWKRENN